MTQPIIYVTSDGIAFFEEHKIFSTIPKTILEIIKTYQIEGVNLMIKILESSMNGCILADDMGLGKTLQLISVILYYINENKLKEDQKILIIVPKTIIQVWQKQFSEYAPNIMLYFFNGNAEEYLNTKPTVILTTYDIIRREKSNILFKETYYLILLDEAHIIKNKGMKISKLIKNLQSYKKIAATGTPMENRFNDFISLFDFICKDYLKDFYNSDKKNKLDYNDDDIVKIRSLIAPYVIRRQKEKVLTLPPITIKTIDCGLNKQQKDIFNSNNFNVEGTYKEILKECKDLTKFHNAWLVIKHPVALTNEYTTAKMSQKMLKFFDLEKNVIPPNEKIILFSLSKRIIKLYSQFSKLRNINHLVLHGDDNSKKRLETVQLFQREDSNIRVFFISTKAGGLGLTLTNANHVIHHDFWWTHSSISQASSRVHRIGQKRPVTVYIFSTKKTFEPSIKNYSDECFSLFNKIFNNLETVPK